ncbi:MAG: hypothetical protein PVJ98_11055, partial [Akkermansiaceae bacterium]
KKSSLKENKSSDIPHGHFKKKQQNYEGSENALFRGSLVSLMRNSDLHCADEVGSRQSWNQLKIVLASMIAASGRT